MLEVLGVAGERGHKLRLLPIDENKCSFLVMH